MKNKGFRLFLSLCMVALLSSCQGPSNPVTTSSSPATTSSSAVESKSDLTSESSLSSEAEKESSEEKVVSSEDRTSSPELSSEEEKITSSEEIASIPELSSEEEGSSSIIANSSREDSSKEQGSTHRPDDDERWPVSFAEYGQAFRNRLAKLIRQSGTKTINYKANNNVLSASDKALNGHAGVIPFYHADDKYTTSWNKEHVWPSSRGAGETGPGSDPQMLRPTASSCNSSRGNKFFGIGENMFDPAECKGADDIYGHYEASRGEAARIIFYCATRYYDSCGSGGSCNGDTPLSLSNNENDSSGKHTMGRLDYLIEWNNQYPVTAQEIRRNDYLHSQGFARNPFIDHPEYANWIWDKEGIRTSAPDSDRPVGSDSIPPLSYKHNYSAISSESDLSSKAGIAGRPNSSSNYYGMTAEAKGPTIPWYISGVEFVYEDNKYKTDSDDVAMFTFNKNSSGNYTISVNGKYLYNYIDGTHYSIGYDVADKTGANNEWKITVSSGGKATIVGAVNTVYLEYYNGSFCGYQYSPKESLVLIH